ncbi:hypothetical protein CHS0354_018847 [Potamilus streckersoni]|uniref:Uncharacterized protein n=1 Tax=Potamilus streckersoni TaxID=2493646 RepID=A0AAE0SII9_9BIVA|nr:hypothetical protein CHS0354_018847 [Potamilus streckersoni]
MNINIVSILKKHRVKAIADAASNREAEQVQQEDVKEEEESDSDRQRLLDLGLEPALDERQK